MLNIYIIEYRISKRAFEAIKGEIMDIFGIVSVDCPDSRDDIVYNIKIEYNLDKVIQDRKKHIDGVLCSRKMKEFSMKYIEEKCWNIFANYANW